MATFAEFGGGDARARRRLAEQMLAQSNGPIRHWSDGLSQGLSAAMAGYIGGQASREEKESQKRLRDIMLSHPGLRDSTAAPALPAAADAPPSPPVLAQRPDSAPTYTAPGMPGLPATAGPPPAPPQNATPFGTLSRESYAEFYGQPPAQPAAPPQNAADPVNRIAQVIVKHESGGKYDIVGPVVRYPSGKVDRPYGAYQVMGSNIPAWTKEVLGKEMTPDEFLRNPQAQDAVAKAKIAQAYKQHGNAEDVFAIWASGRPLAQSASNKDLVFGTTVKDIVAKRVADLSRLNGSPAGPQVAEAPPASPPANASDASGIPPQMRLYIKSLIESGEPQAMALGNQLLTQYSTPDKPTDDTREYNMAVRQGYKGTLLDYIKEVKQAGASKNVMTVDQRGESEFRKTTGKGFGEQYLKLQEGAMSARSKIATLDALGQSLANAGRTGFAAETMLEVNRAAKALGITDKDLGPAEAARAIANQLALQLRNPSSGAGMPGAMSDKDREFLVASVPGLTRTPEGNVKLIEYMKRLEQRNIEVAQMANDYVRKHGQLDPGFYDELSRFSAAKPLFPEAEKPTTGAPKKTKSGIQYEVE